MTKEIKLNTKLLSSLSSVLFMSVAEMIVATGIANSTWYRVMAAPACITIQQLLALSNGLRIPVRKFFSEGKVDIIGQREDYIAKSYQPCYYDDTKLQHIVNNSSAATWKNASKVIGVSRSNLRNSLLAVTRTPVSRFLAVCKAFSIDPFTILIDPNDDWDVKIKKVQKKQNDATGKNTEVLSEPSHGINALNKKIDKMSVILDDLKKKYEALLKRHEDLAHRVDSSMRKIDSSYIGLAAESDSDSD